MWHLVRFEASSLSLGVTVMIGAFVFTEALHGTIKRASLVIGGSDTAYIRHYKT